MTEAEMFIPFGIGFVVASIFMTVYMSQQTEENKRKKFK